MHSVRIQVIFKFDASVPWEIMRPMEFTVHISEDHNEGDVIVNFIRDYERIYTRGDNRPLVEIRWNYKDSYQGHYLNPMRYPKLSVGDRCAVIDMETGAFERKAWVLYHTNTGKFAISTHCENRVDLFQDDPVRGIYFGTGTAKAFGIRALTLDEISR